MREWCSLALHKKVLQYSPSIVQGRSPILPIASYDVFLTTDVFGGFDLVNHGFGC